METNEWEQWKTIAPIIIAVYAGCFLMRYDWFQTLFTIGFMTMVIYMGYLLLKIWWDDSINKKLTRLFT